MAVLAAYLLDQVISIPPSTQRRLDDVCEGTMID